MANYFNLTNDDISKVSIFRTADGEGCFVAERDKFDQYKFYDGFVLCDGPRRQTICGITFYPSSKTGKYIPRLIFYKNHKNSGEIKETSNQQVIIEFSSSEQGYEQFWQMIAFLFKFKKLVDLGEFDKAYRVQLAEDFENQEKPDQIVTIQKLIEKLGLTTKEAEKLLVNNTRVQSLKVFKKLLLEKDYWKEYEQKSKDEMTERGEEAVWHHFIKNNDWILGLNVDIRFIRELVSEQSVGTASTQNRGNPQADFLGIRDYTVLVEFKTPNTKIFTEVRKSTSRTNTWSFTDHFIDGVSQCSAQKSDWDKSCAPLEIEGQVLNQNLIRTIDPESIFIIGNKKEEFPEDSESTEILVKRDTFHRFRRNSRNVMIVTFDELYERAYHIVYGRKDQEDKDQV